MWRWPVEKVMGSGKMKRCGFLVMAFLVIVVILQPVVAADALHRMLHGEQDVILLGQIEGHDPAEGLLTLRLIRVIQGKATDTTVQVKDDFTYFGFSEENGKPGLGDYVVLSLNEKGGHYEQAWFMVRTDHGHMRSLTIYYEPAAGPAPADLKALQYFVNTRGKVTDYYFDGGQVFARRKLFSDVDLTDSLTPWVSEAEAAAIADQAAEMGEEDKGLNLGVILSGFMLFFFTMVIFIRIRAVFLTQRRMARQNRQNS